MSNQKISALIFIGFCSSSMAENQDELVYPQAFLAIKGGYQWADDSTFTGKMPNDKIFGASAGLKFSENWRWDLGYQYNYPLVGKFHNPVQNTDSTTTFNTQLFETKLRYDWYLNQKVSLYANVGAAYWQVEKTNAFSLATNDKGYSPIGGVGVNMNLTPRISLSAGYQYIDSIGGKNTGNFNSHAAVLELSYTFTRKNTAQPFIETQPDPIQYGTENTISVNYGQDYSFKINSSEVVYPLTEKLDEVATILLAQPQAIVNIIGHTDSTGTEAYNQQLSVLRAEKAAQYLESVGIYPQQIVTSGQGESNPMYNNDTIEGRAQNRRVEVILSSNSIEIIE